MSLTWDADTMSTGVPDIDLQHRQLIGEINRLFELMQQGRGMEQIEPILDFCASYAQKHFRHEESCMQRLECPAFAQNKQAHAQFLATFTQFRERLRREGVTLRLTLEVQKQLSDWLRNHIVRTDTALRPCVGAAGSSPTH